MIQLLKQVLPGWTRHRKTGYRNNSRTSVRMVRNSVLPFSAARFLVRLAPRVGTSVTAISVISTCACVPPDERRTDGEFSLKNYSCKSLRLGNEDL